MNFNYTAQIEKNNPK